MRIPAVWRAGFHGGGCSSTIVTDGGSARRQEKAAPQTGQDRRQPHIGRPGRRERHNHGDPVADRQAGRRVT